MARWPWRKAITEQKTESVRAVRRPELIEAASLFGELGDSLDELYIAAEKRLAQQDFHYDRQAGCNVGDHLRRAASMMEARLAAVPDGPPGAFLPAAIHALDDSRTAYLETYDDPDWFGVGAHNKVIRIALDACDRHGVPRPEVEDTLPIYDFGEDEYDADERDE